MTQKNPQVIHESARLFAPPEVDIERRADGSVRLRSPQPLRPYARCVGEYLVRWARAAPDRPYLLERSAAGTWEGIRYGEAAARVQAIGAWLLSAQLSVERPIAILSENSVEHGLLALAAMHIGVPIVPVSPAYALMSKDFGKLKAIFKLVHPGLVFVADAARYGPALAAVAGLHEGPVVTGSRSQPLDRAIPFAALSEKPNVEAVAAAFAAVGPDTIAKILFTSGSTDEPKGVVNTQRMLCANQQAMEQVWPFLRETPPVIVDWLPWNHTFGANHNFNIVLRHGGTLYIDAGRPLPGLFDHSAANLGDGALTVYFNVPRGYDMLIAAMRSDAQLRANFFSRLQLIFYAAAALPQHLWEALESASLETLGRKVPMVSSWGLTETAPAATSCHFQAERSGVIGIPLPGCELKLVPNGDKLEARVRGPNVTPGYWKRPDLTAQSFDEEGYYRTGDAMRFVDAAQPRRGLLFDGRVLEDFKLSSGTWVDVGGLRTRAVAALAPVVQDIVIAGHDRDEVGFLIFPNVAACRQLCRDLPADAPIEKLLAHATLRRHVAAALAALRREGGGSSTYAARALLMAEPPSIDASEITDKGNINQRAALARRAALVERLYRVPIDPAVIRPSAADA
jgi:feruloyl-CoA synthase